MNSTCHTVSIPNADRTPKFQRKCTKISVIIALYVRRLTAQHLAHKVGA